jgi:O-antigen/teichoic acid export membrane protein
VLFAFNFYTVMSAYHVTLIFSLVSLLFIVIGTVYLWNMYVGKWQLKGHIEKENSGITPPSPRPIELIKSIWPFGLATFFYIIYYQSDIVFLKYMVGDHAAGYYNVAFSIMAAIYLFPGVIYQKYLLPKMHRWANQDEDKFFQVYSYGNKAMLILGVVGMFGIWSTGFWAIPLLFGSEYQDSILILNILALSTPLIFLAFNSGATLVTKDYMRIKVKYMGVTALINIILNVLLIPIYQEVGAAVATVLSNFLLMVLFHHGAKNYVFNDDRRGSFV